MDGSKTISSPRHAVLMGAVLGMLMKAEREEVLRLRPVILMDEDGYTNVAELREPEDDTPVFRITVDQVA